MTRRIVVSLSVLAAILIAGVSSATAQTAGTSSLEQIGYLMKKSYAFNLNNARSVLSLRDITSGSQVMTISKEGRDGIVVDAVLGDMSSLSAAGRERLRDNIFFMNTRLPVGTIVVDPSGLVRMEHRLNTALVPMPEITTVISLFSNEVARRRAELFA